MRRETPPDMNVIPPDYRHLNPDMDVMGCDVRAHCVLLTPDMDVIARDIAYLRLT